MLEPSNSWSVKLKLWEHRKRFDASRCKVLGQLCFLRAPQWYSAGVFIVNRGSGVPCQGQLHPQLPTLSPEYSPLGGYGGSLQRNQLHTWANPLSALPAWRPMVGTLRHGPTIHGPPFIMWKITTHDLPSPSLFNLQSP